MAKFIGVDGVERSYAVTYCDRVIREYPTEVLRRVANRLSRSEEDFVYTTANPTANPRDLVECMEILRDFIMEYYMYADYANGCPYDAHISAYVYDGRYAITNRYVGWTMRGTECYVYATRKSNPIIMKFDLRTGEILHHAPTDERWDMLFQYNPRPIFCVETGETDPEKLIWIGGSYNLPILDRGQYISREFLIEHGGSICPDCGSAMIEEFTSRRAYDFNEGGYVYVCNCHSCELKWCDGHQRWEIHGGNYHRVDDSFYCDESYAQLDTFVCSCGRETNVYNRRTYVDDITGVATEMCPMCYRNAMRGRIDWDNVDGLLTYSTKPRLTFFDKDGASRTCRTPLSIGIEDELDQAHSDCPSSRAADRAAVEIMRKFKGEIYCKYDGSLEDGSEQVSMPHSIEAFESFDWDGMFEITRKHDLLPNSTCGFHAHINNGGLGDTRTEQKRTAAKLAMVMDLHRDTFFTLSCREERYDFDHWAGSSALDGRWEFYLTRPCAACDYLYERGYRYRAVNFTNEHTIEIRIFAATDERDIALANINVVYALVRMCKKTSMKSLYQMDEDELCANLIKYAYNKDVVEKLLRRVDLI